MKRIACCVMILALFAGVIGHGVAAPVESSVVTAQSFETALVIDAAKIKEDFIAITEINKKKSEEYGKIKVAWKERKAAAEKAGEQFDEPEPKRDYKDVFDVSIYPEAEERAAIETAELKAAWKLEKEAWEKADPAVRTPKPPQEPHSVKVEVLPTDTIAIKSTEGYREPLYGRIWFHPLNFKYDFKNVGNYKVWMRYYCGKDKYRQISFRVVAPNEETCRFEILNRIPNVYENLSNKTIDRSSGKEAGWYWVSADLAIESPGTYTIELEPFNKNLLNEVSRKVSQSPFGINQVWITNNPNFDPNVSPLVESEGIVTEVDHGGLIPARHHPIHANLNMAVRDSQKRLLTNFMESYGWYHDLRALITLGAVDIYSSGSRDTVAPLGISFQQDVSLSSKEQKPKQPPVVREEGEDWYSYRKRKNARKLENAIENVKRTIEKDYDDLLACWWTAWEECGTYDYSDESEAEFRIFLETKYGSIDALNDAWKTEYTSFDEINPAKWSDFYGDKYKDMQQKVKRASSAYASNKKDPEVVATYRSVIEENARFEHFRHQQMANFVDFRDFRSKLYAMEIGIKTEAVMAADTHGIDGKPRHVSSNLSANNIASVMWMQWRPLCFEDTAQITMKGSDMIGYDNYGTDDLMGSFYEIFDSFGDGKLLPMVREGSTHAPDPNLYARTIWGNVSKGMRGMDTFVMHESGNGSNQGELQKFGLQNMYDDGAPRPKLAAASDNYRAMHQLDHLLTETKRERAVKPIAIYYSSVCNLLQERPYASIFDPGPDNFFRVYELMHANGYDVTFVTDRQIREGGEWLKNLKAIVFVDATYIPEDVQEKLFAWVENGGHIFADAQTGSCNDHTFPTPKFNEFLGIEPVKQVRVADDAASKLSFGYSAYSFDVINRDELFQTSCEVKDTPGATHPINKILGKAMISAMGYNEVKCVNGSVILQENNTRPYMIARNHGKGTSVYFAGYAGTMYGAGCTQYEWRDKHSDNSPYRIMDAWLKWISAEKIAENDLPRDAKYSLRFESPLTDARGNAFLGIVSQLPVDCQSFRVKYKMPKGFKAPRVCLATRNGSREIIEVPFSFNEETRELSIRVPEFKVWTSILALNNLEPLVSVSFGEGIKRDAYNLADIRPGDVITANVKVFNPSNEPLSGSKVVARLPDGWLYDKETINVPTVAPYSYSQELSFTIEAPAVCTARRLKPLNFVLEHPSLPNGSGPAVEMVWFQKSPQKETPVSFEVK